MMMMMIKQTRKIPLATLSTPSTAITSEVEMAKVGGSAFLKFEFDRDQILFQGGIAFAKVRAIRWRAEGHCTAWHIEDVYDNIVEVENSPWVDELKSSQASDRTQRTMRHFMVYFDSAGCFECVAASFDILPDEKKL